MWALPNKSFNLTPPALRGVRRSGAVKRAPQVNSNPLACFQNGKGKVHAGSAAGKWLWHYPV